MRAMSWVVVGVLLAGTSAQAAQITFEDFESGPATGWSNGAIDSDPAFSRFLGRFAGGSLTPSKTYTLPAPGPVTIEFDFYEIDSWDAETFSVLLNGTTVFSETFQHAGHGADNDPLLFMDPVTNGSSNLGFNPDWSDQKWHFTGTFPVAGTSLTVAFISTVNQFNGDESWGIDNLRITTPDVNVIPLPAAAWGGVALLGVMVAARVRRAQVK